MPLEMKVLTVPFFPSPSINILLKNRSKTYLLLAIVAVLWGILIFKFASDLSDDSLPSQSFEISSFKAPKNTKKDTTPLLNIDRDPFLGTPYVSKSSSQKSTKVPVKKVINWPQIKYKGMVKGENNSSFIVQINGQDKIFNRGEELDSIILIRGNASKATLRFKGISKEFELQ